MRDAELHHLEEVYALKRLRVKFIKGDKVKFLGHLDILRTFNRAIRRSGVPVAYSQGFNPHPVISFGLPLSVGVTSECELVDLDVDSDIAPQEFVDMLNVGLPEGLRALSAIEVDPKSIAMAEIRRAKYNVKINGNNLDNIDAKVNELLNRENIVVLKETKSGGKEADIKPDIREISVLTKDKNNAELVMDLSAGSVSNLKPEFVVEGLKKYCDIEVNDIDVHRIELGI